MNYNPQLFVYKPEDTLFFTKEIDVPIMEKTCLGELIVGYSKQKLIYGRTTPDPIIGLYEFELIG